jgi:hypothetical protein
VAPALRRATAATLGKRGSTRAFRSTGRPSHAQTSHSQRWADVVSPEYVATCAAMARIGCTDREMAASLSMGYETFRDWLVRHPELREVVQIEKAVADQRVVESLFLRATGYTRQAQRPLIDRAGRPVVVSFEEAVPPDVVAQMFWLKNRQRDLWTDTVNHVLAISTPDDLKAARERVVQNPPTDGARFCLIWWRIQSRVLICPRSMRHRRHDFRLRLAP